MKSTSLKLILVSLLLVACSRQETDYAITNTSEIDALTIKTYPYEKEAPKFPNSVQDYELEKQKSVESIRIFQDGGWVVPIEEFDPQRNGGATMSCEPYFWIMRWRSNNPEVELIVGAGLTDSGFEQSGEKQQGGTGIIYGFSCFVPGLSFGKTLNGNLANLADVNYEYQIWKYKPKV